MSYETVREIAGSIGLIYMLVLFAGMMAFTFRPGSKKYYDKAARIPLDRD